MNAFAFPVHGLAGKGHPVFPADEAAQFAEGRGYSFEAVAIAGAVE